ncbi:hypothetical protein I317_02525 [Kwoniella heveanensis CBS 569]|nr:hypothetical protein I317_02525 [Kwoniella heveanensis CBS 569]
MSLSGPSRVGGTYTSSGRQSLPPLSTLQSLSNYNGMGGNTTPRSSGVPTRSSLGSAGLPGLGGGGLPSSKSLGSLSSYANNGHQHSRDHSVRGSSESAHGNGNGNGTGVEKAKKKKNKKGMKGWAWVVEDENGNIVDAPEEESDEDAKAKAKAKANAQAKNKATSSVTATEAEVEAEADTVATKLELEGGMDIDGHGRDRSDRRSVGSENPISVSRASISSAPLLLSNNDFGHDIDGDLSSPPPVFSRASSALTDLAPVTTKRTRRTSSPATVTGTNTAAGTPSVEVNDRKSALSYL